VEPPAGIPYSGEIVAQITGIGSPISEVLARGEESFLNEWIQNIHASTRSSASIAESELRQQCQKFLASFRAGLDDVGASNPNDPRWKELRDLLGD
jgi:hypothetical protein